MVGASHGIVFLPNEADEPSIAMQIADQRLYGNKGARRRSGRQPADARRAAPGAPGAPARSPRAPARGRRDGRSRSGRNMSLLPEELDEMARAAELHDVGKMAIPDEILNKPGPLDRGRARLHPPAHDRRRADPRGGAGAHAGRRASCGRATRTGTAAATPTGCSGEQIPLASRIIAVCDAFHAMTSERPYAAAVSVDDALAELRRCAGTQFDPAVVDVLGRASCAASPRSRRSRSTRSPSTSTTGCPRRCSRPSRRAGRRRRRCRARA